MKGYKKMSNLHKLKTLLPLEELEQSAQGQIYDALNLDFLKVLAIMPDCHTGYSLPIGGVALLDNVISPAYVGYDIGCGMCCVVTDVDINDIGYDKDYILDELYKRITVGFDCRDKGLDYKEFKSAMIGNKKLNKKVNERLYVQLGTLGGGNHFIEVGYNRNGKVCVTIHSGSRNPGHSVASYWMKLSKNVDKHLPNGFLDLGGEYGQDFLKDMTFMQEYALNNRKVMMKIVLDVLGLKGDNGMINENHNHAIVTNEGVLHRKGATPADKDQLGVIPGNMTDGVFITKGLGNEEYLCSASHGAGRKFSRKRAKELIDFEQVKKEMEGITCRLKKGQIDESRGAYKDINMVIERQEGIVVDVVDHITPVISMKG
jgi:tRNA-splicing ligase RtcB (3'-phosphate/5'-hydroxy nucleic acid ligase)